MAGNFKRRLTPGSVLDDSKSLKLCFATCTCPDKYYFHFTYKCPLWAAVWHRSPDHNLWDKAREFVWGQNWYSTDHIPPSCAHCQWYFELGGAGRSSIRDTLTHQSWFSQIGNYQIFAFSTVFFGATMRKWNCKDENQEHAHHLSRIVWFRLKRF